MAKCDLCSSSCKAEEMTQLYPQYRTDGIIDLCQPCSKWANLTKLELLGRIGPQMQEAIRKRKGIKATPTKHWWQRCAVTHP